jgi:hypothetical protein
VRIHVANHILPTMPGCPQDILLNSAPVTLSVEGRRGIRLPARIEGAEEEHVAVEVGADRVQGHALVFSRGDSGAVGIALVRPAGLCDHDALVAGGSDAVYLALDEGAGVRGFGVSIEEGVDVAHDNVGGFADGGVVDHDWCGLDGAHGAIETGSSE